MSLLLAGLTVLMIGDSHMATRDYLITTLHDDLMQQGAKVYSFGSCGTPASAWMKAGKPECGSAFRLDNAPVRERRGDASYTKSLPELVNEYHPNLIVVINGDTMAGYKSGVMPRPWIRDEVSSLTREIKASGAKCVWVGPAWGSEGGKYGKTFARTKEVSDYLADIVSPCVYISSLNMEKPGEWATLPGDGQHYMNAGYQAWGNAITQQIISSDILQKIMH